MDRFAYTALLLVFFVPTFWVLMRRHKHIFKRQAKLIIAITVFGIVGYFVTITLGAWWGAWAYDYTKTSNIRIGKDLFETLLWTIAGCMVISAVIGEYADREDKKKKFKL